MSADPQLPADELVTLQAPAGEIWDPANPTKCMAVLRSLANHEVRERDYNCAYLAAFAVHMIDRLTVERDQYKQIAELNAETIRKMQVEINRSHGIWPETCHE